jgi:hypothetical protein
MVQAGIVQLLIPEAFAAAYNINRHGGRVRNARQAPEARL